MIKPVRQTCAAQQRNFDAFRHEYNDERPHETLGQQTPASQCQASSRAYPARLPVPEYPGHYLVKTMNTAGTFRRINHGPGCSAASIAASAGRISRCWGSEWAAECPC